jgi:hypothetical protein
MKRLTAGFLIVSMCALPSCSSGTANGPEGVRVDVRWDVKVSDNPLGDVVIGDLMQGNQVTALCFVRRAQTNAGYIGSAIRINEGDLSGYAAVTDFPEDPADRQMMFNLDATTLRARLPACSQ